MNLIEKYLKFYKEKNSILCVGIDPALPKQRQQNTIPNNYLEGCDANEARLNFCLDIIDAVKDYALAIKINQQYVFGMTKTQHQHLNTAIKRNGMLSILDYKLNDINESVKSAIFHLSDSGYDAITYNPFPGNLQKVVQLAHDYVKTLRGDELGILVVTLMSNLEAPTYMKNATIGGVPLFAYISQQIRDCDADGCVVGATNHITVNEIKKIRTTVGIDKVFLIPGIGAQKGDVDKVLKAAGTNILMNVGRDIIYSKNIKRKAEKYNTKFKNIPRNSKSSSSSSFSFSI